jgi:hypothetical protein
VARDDEGPRVQAQTEAQAAAERERLRRLALAAELAGGKPPHSGAQTAPPAGSKPVPIAREGGLRPAQLRTAVIAAAVAVAVVWAGASLFPGSDHVSDAQKVAWQAAFLAAPPQVAHRIPAADVPAALDGMSLPPEQRTQLETALAEGRTQLVYLTLTDVVAEDLDRVRIDSEGYSAEVTILHRTTKVVFPEPSSGVVNVTGTYDGGGGITIAITSGETPVNLPFMDVGQVVGIPVVVGP